MKHLIIFLFTIGYCFGQDSETRKYAGGLIHVNDGIRTGTGLSDTLLINDKKNTVNLNGGWLRTFSDDSTFKTTEFSDTKWEKSKISTEYKDLSIIKSDTIAWFRKTIYVDSATVGVPLLFDVRAAGAWEFYLDGKLVETFGKIDKVNPETYINLKSIRIPILFDHSGTHQLIFRFLFDASAKVNIDTDISPLKVIVRRSDQDHLKDDRFDIKEATGIVVGLFLLAAIIHWFFYFQFKTNKRDAFNIFLFVSMLCFACFNYIASPSLKTFELSGFVIRETLEGFFFVAGHCLLLVAVHKYLLQKSYKLLWFTVGLAFTSGFLSNFIENPTYADYCDLAAGILVLGVYVYMIIKAKRQKIKSSKTLLNALLYFLIVIVLSIVLLTVVSTVSVFGGFDMQKSVLSILAIFIIIIMAGPQLAISFAVSSDLAKEFVQTNKTLSKKIEEIELLSKEKEDILQQQNEKLEELVTTRTAELNQTVNNLKSTQAQLIQSEKLASLGELTAGIAHEIQNPLNFVNNFSEVSEELIEELAEERERPKEERDEELENEIIGDLKGNLNKISHHGKRASGIVKSMLEHSRISDGHKEPSDINKLADEYLRLAYHGIRAKDRSFNAKMETILAEGLPLIKLITQDIGRVFLNVINNAFQSPKPTNADENYMKLVTITTEKQTGCIRVSIADNGAGIPESIKDKVFQPFFTTKPTGEGTGLGLSLAHDIVKAHGGKMEVESKQNEGTTFVITLPVA